MLSPDSFLLLLYHMQGPEGAPFGRKGARLAPWVVEKGCGKGFLRLTGPMGRKVRKFDGLLGRGLWYRPQGDEYKVSVTGFTFSVIWQNNHSADWLATLATPYPGCAGLPPMQGTE